MIVATRQKFQWSLLRSSLSLGERTLVMGVLNATPDSFSDNGKFLSSEKAIEHALQMLGEGANILDIGGESTRPGTRPAVSAQEELDRVLPVIETVLRERPNAIVSIDTYKAATAHAAIQAGAEIVNDVSGFLWDAEMASLCVELGCGVVLMHTRGKMHEWRTQPRLPQDAVVPLVLRELRERIEDALQAAVRQEKIVIDPGFGFGKAGDENYPLLAQFDRLGTLGYPILAGTSRKSFLGRPLEKTFGTIPPPELRSNATIASIVACVLGGAHIVRAHDVKAAREAVAIADAIRESA